MTVFLLRLVVAYPTRRSTTPEALKLLQLFEKMPPGAGCKVINIQKTSISRFIEHCFRKHPGSMVPLGVCVKYHPVAAGGRVGRGSPPLQPQRAWMVQDLPAREVILK